MATPDPGSLLEEVAAELVSYCESRADYGLLQFGSLIGAHQYFRLYRVLLRHTPRGSKVLDWGCGNGHFSYALVRLGYKAVGFSGYDSPSHHLREVLSPTGYEFYEMAASRIGGDAREALTKLARWERDHERLFKALHDRAFEAYSGMPWGG